MPDRKVGTVFDLDALRTDERVLTWLRWSPFENTTCRDCKLLPACAGSCAHKFLNPEQTSGEAASLPCPSWKYNINERLIYTAQKSGALSNDDYLPEEISTDPSSLCAYQ